MIETHDQEICSLEAEIDRLTAERDRQYDQNVEQIVQIASLQAKVDELEGDLNIMRLQRDATHVSRCPTHPAITVVGTSSHRAGRTLP